MHRYQACTDLTPEFSACWTLEDNVYILCMILIVSASQVFTQQQPMLLGTGFSTHPSVSEASDSVDSLSQSSSPLESSRSGSRPTGSNWYGKTISALEAIFNGICQQDVTQEVVVLLSQSPSRKHLTYSRELSVCCSQERSSDILFINTTQIWERWWLDAINRLDWMILVAHTKNWDVVRRDIVNRR